jgi:hypothetical protein
MMFTKDVKPSWLLEKHPWVEDDVCKLWIGEHRWPSDNRTGHEIWRFIFINLISLSSYGSRGGRAWERGIKAGLLLCKSQREKINLLMFTWQPFWCCGLPNCYAIIAQRVARICVSEPSGDNRYRVPIEMTASSERIQKW